MSFLTHPMTQSASFGVAFSALVGASSACHPHVEDQGPKVATVYIPELDEYTSLSDTIPDLDGDQYDEFLEVPRKETPLLRAAGWSTVELSTHQPLNAIGIRNAAPHSLLGCDVTVGLCRMGLGRREKFFRYDPQTDQLESYEAQAKLPETSKTRYVTTLGFDLPPAFQETYHVGEAVYFKGLGDEGDQVQSGQIQSFKIYARIGKRNKRGGVVEGRVFSTILYAVVRTESRESHEVPFHHLCGKKSKR